MMENNNFVFGKDNYTFILAGILCTFIGFVLMMGGASDDPNVFNPEIFSPMRITVAPFLVILGYAVVIYGIMKKRKISK